MSAGTPDETPAADVQSLQLHQLQQLYAQMHANPAFAASFFPPDLLRPQTLVDGPNYPASEAGAEPADDDGKVDDIASIMVSMRHAKKGGLATSNEAAARSWTPDGATASGENQGSSAPAPAGVLPSIEDRSSSLCTSSAYLYYLHC